MLGVLKAGCTYVPIDKDYPYERIKTILQETKVQVCLSDERLSNEDIAQLESPDCDFVATKDLLETEYSEFSGEKVDQRTTAYILYTSGSTGKPKGVCISHRNMVNYLHWANQYYFDNGRGWNFPLFTSLSFDLTVTSVFSTLLRGDTLHIYRENEINQVLKDIFSNVDISSIKLTPSHISLLKELDITHTHIEKAIVGGEKLTKGQVKILRGLNSSMSIYNEYGPTEATVGCIVEKIEEIPEVIKIGKPIANTKIYILDEQMQLTPKGVNGEIFIAGEGLAKGYFNNPELTKEKFVEDTIGGYGTMYRSGDMGRWLPDGSIELFGRKDAQVKFNGHRIELEEIENVLNTHESVLNSTVALKEHSVNDSHHQTVKYCTKCGIASNYPRITFDKNDVCSICNTYAENKEKISKYFRDEDELQLILDDVRKSNSEKEYDCLALFSGGKDSTYVLCQLVKKYKLKVLAFTLENGYISEEAKDNIRKVTETLGVDHVFGETPYMNEIFVESLHKFNNVCDGCFKTIYTLAYKVAKEKNIKYIMTGLSRGQLFETRLHHLFESEMFDPEEIDQRILSARKAYFNIKDKVTSHVADNMFEDDKIIDDIKIIDFYRYSDVELSEMYGYLDEYVPWVRPSDTGRSTNCLINNAGIYIHKKLRGYHNYSLPYSWDVRIGHKKREEAMYELDDEISPDSVEQILDEIGYTDSIAETEPQKNLVAYYQSKVSLNPEDLRNHLALHLPAYMIPSHFVSIDAIPVNVHGKVDRSRLPEIDFSKYVSRKPDREAKNDVERSIRDIWKAILKVDNVGLDDNFFELGGTSIKVVVLLDKLGLQYPSGLKLTDLFDYPTVAGQAELVQGQLSTETTEETGLDILKF